MNPNFEYQERLIPELHDTFFVGDRVQINGMNDKIDGYQGEIVGIATAHIMFQYIIELDEPMSAPSNHPGKSWKCVVISGGCLNRTE